MRPTDERTMRESLAKAGDAMFAASEALFRARRVADHDSAAYRTLGAIRDDLLNLKHRLCTAPELGADITGE